MRRRALGVAALLGVLLTLLLAGPASAHPLGNFTVNTYSGLVVGPQDVRVTHVRDLAEIPTLTAMETADADTDGTLSEPELAAYAAADCAATAQDVSLRVDGRPVALRVDAVVQRGARGRGRARDAAHHVRPVRAAAPRAARRGARWPWSTPTPTPASASAGAR